MPPRRSTSGTATFAAPAPSPGTGVVEAHRRLRARITQLGGDRELGPDLAVSAALVHDGSLVDLVAPGADATGPDGRGGPFERR